MRILPGVFIFSATTLCYCLPLVLSFEYNAELRPRLLSRRAIDGTRGRKHFNPKEDNFFDDYGFEKGQYHGEKEKPAYEDLKSNVPGEPGVDYPAFVKIPRTTFSCIGRDRGYYADEEAGCQVFHVCDEGLVSTFICPIGSLFSQRLLTCDWWTKVSCSKSKDFFGLQQHAKDVSLTDRRTLHHTLSEKKEPVATVTDQKKEQNQAKKTTIIVTVKKNENQLEQNQKQKPKSQFIRGQSHAKDQFVAAKKDDSPIINIKPAAKDNKMFGVKEQSRPNYITIHGRYLLRPHSSKVQFTQLRNVSASTISSVNRATTSPTIVSKVDRLSVSLAASQNESTGTVATLKKGLNEDVTKSTKPINIDGDHNSASEYDDMESKDSIGLVKSPFERKLEKEESDIVTTENTTTDVTTIESIGSTTPITEENIEMTTQTNEDIQAKESIGLVHSKIQEKFQLFGQENGKKSVNSVEDIIGSTVLYQSKSTTESPKGAASFISSSTNNTQTASVRRMEQFGKMSGFLINVAEKGVAEATTLPYDEISSSDYQELLNSSDASFTSTILPATITPEDLVTVTTGNSEEPTTIMVNNVRRISDTVEESNSPFGVMLPLNGSSEFSVSGSQSPITVNLLGQLISQHERQPIDLTNLEIVRSNEANQQVPQNQGQVSASMSNVRSYQHFRSNPIQQDNQQNYRNYQQLPIVATTFRNYQEQYVPTTTPVPQQNYDDYQNHHESQNDYTNYNIQVSRNQQFMLTTTETAPPQDYENYQNQQFGTTSFNNLQDFTNQPITPSSTSAPQSTSESFRNNLPNRIFRGNFRHSKIQNYASTGVRNRFPDPVESVLTVDQNDDSINYNSYQNQPQEYVAFNNYQNQPEETTKFNNLQNQPQINVKLNTQQNQQAQVKNQHSKYTTENVQNYVSYEMRHEADNFPDYKQNYYYQTHQTTGTPQVHHKPQPNFAVNPQTLNYQIQTTQIPQIHTRSQSNIDNTQNYVSQQNTKHLESTEDDDESDTNTQNYDYDNTEDILKNISWFKFGERISARNPSTNILKLNTKRPKITEISSNTNDAQSINAGLQGKAANFLWTMSQLAKTDRLPRPFTQNKDKSENSFNRQQNNDHRNNFVDNKPRQNVNNFRSVPLNVNNYNSNYNDNQQYPVIVDDFAAPRFAQPQFNFQNNNQQTGKINEPRQERILTSVSPPPPPPPSENPVIPILLNAQAGINSYHIENIQSEVNTVPFNKNAQFIEVPAPNLSQYSIESTSNSNSNEQILRDPQSQSVDYSDYQQNTQTPEVQNEPQSQTIDFDYQITTQPTTKDSRVPQRNVEIVQDTQDFRPTITTSNREIISSNQKQRYSNFNSTKEGKKTVVETEFIPSLSFDFGSDQGRKEFLEALEKGLVPNDNARSIDGDVSSSNSATVAIETTERDLTQETTISDIMDNFKDTGAIMSGTE